MAHQRSYQQLVQALTDGRIAKAALWRHADALTPLDHNLLEDLAAEAADAGPRRPKRAWALTAVADAAAQQTDDPFLKGKAAWHLAAAANEWVRPRRVAEAAERAREQFQALNEPGWLAACDWQLNSLAWTRPNFAEAAVALERALDGLLAAGRSEALLCRRDLAYAQILTSQYQKALENLEISQRGLESDKRELGICRLVRSSYLRRTGENGRAHQELTAAMTLFEELNLPINGAHARFQLAYVARATDDYPAAETHFKMAAAVFQEHDIPVWVAQCEQGLAQLALNLGHLRRAAELLEKARAVFEEHNIPGPLADTYLDSGMVARYFSNFQKSLTLFQQAEESYATVGAPAMVAVAIQDQGDALWRLGRYQPALKKLEKAREQFQALHLPHRVGECALRLASIWQNLGRADLAHTYLDQVIDYFEQHEPGAFLLAATNRKAETFHNEGEPEEALRLLQRSLALAERLEIQPQLRFTQWLLGEVLLALDRLEEGFAWLQTAESGFAEMGMLMEQALCHISIGRYHYRAGRETAAAAAWQRAIELGGAAMPEISWQAQAGLAILTEESDDQAAALHAYRQMAKSLSQLRRWFWQPGLAGSYLQRTAASLDRAVHLAARTNAARHALQFVEEFKAQTLNRQLADIAPERATSDLDSLDETAANIRRLRQAIAADSQKRRGLIWSPNGARLRRELQAELRQFDHLLGQQERRGEPRAMSGSTPGFDPDGFRRLAASALGERWLALSYHFHDAQLTCVVLSPDDCQVELRPVTAAAQSALDWLTSHQPQERWLHDRDFEALGRWLVSDGVLAQLDPDVPLLIAPHRRLHGVPWASLLVGQTGRRLISVCVPVVTPSLSSLALLWQRPSSAVPRRDGLLTAISQFAGRDSLPEVVYEADRLAIRLGDGGIDLRETAVTRWRLRDLAGDDGLDRFAFWHIASHAFHDPTTGRLSGIALHDDDLRQDEVWRWAPLPDLVTLSACSSMQSRIYEGDEHVGLAATLLEAGAQAVVGSLWPVPDRGAAELMLAFYNSYFDGYSPAEALALAQRTAIGDGHSVDLWASFICLGAP